MDFVATSSTSLDLTSVEPRSLETKDSPAQVEVLEGWQRTTVDLGVQKLTKELANVKVQQAPDIRSLQVQLQLAKQEREKCQHQVQHARGIWNR